MVRCTKRLLSSEIVHAFSHFLTMHLRRRSYFATEHPSCAARLDVYDPPPYNEKNQLFGSELPSAARTEDYCQFAENRLPDEGESAPKRAQIARTLGTNRHLRAHTQGTQRRSRLHPARRSA